MNDLLSLSGVSNNFTKRVPAISSTDGEHIQDYHSSRQKGLCQILSSSSHTIRARPRELPSFTELAYRVIMKLRSYSAHTLSSILFLLHIIGTTCLFSKAEDNHGLKSEWPFIKSLALKVLAIVTFIEWVLSTSYAVPSVKCASCT